MSTPTPIFTREIRLKPNPAVAGRFVNVRLVRMATLRDLKNTLCTHEQEHHGASIKWFRRRGLYAYCFRAKCHPLTCSTIYFWRNEKPTDVQMAALIGHELGHVLMDAVEHPIYTHESRPFPEQRADCFGIAAALVVENMKLLRFDWKGA